MPLVTSWKSIFLIVLSLLGVFSSPAIGQAVSGFYGEGPPPPRPAFNVQDNAGLFQRDPDRLREISDRLRQLEQRHGFHVYVVVESVVMGSSPIELAARLQQAWLPDGDGFVIVFEADNRSFGLGRAYEASSVEELKATSEIPSFYAADAFDRIRARLDPGLEDPAGLLDQMTQLLVADIGGYLDRRHAPESAGTTLRLVLASLGVLSALGLAGLGVARLLHQTERRRRRTYRFPSAAESQRLGAPFGAKVSSRRFAEPAHPLKSSSAVSGPADGGA